MNIPEKKIPCSVEILTRNSAETLARCLESVKDFAEIIVLDGNSTDATRAIAARYGCRILKQYETDKPLISITDFSEVRNKGLRLASYDWFMFIDSDEYFSPEAVREIRGIVESKDPPVRVFWQPRTYVLDGRAVACATTYPNRQIRFFHRGSVGEFVKPIHERIEVRPGAAIGTLSGIEYVPLGSRTELERRWARYIDAEVAMHRNTSGVRLLRHAVRSLALFSLYALRYVRNLFFCRGARMPFSYEWARHRYTLKFPYRLCREAIKKIFRSSCSAAYALLKKSIFLKLIPIVFLCAMVFTFFSPLLFSNQMIAGEEEIGAYYPMMAFYQKAIQEGDSFFWNKFYYGGFPTYLNLLGGFLYPLHYFLFRLLPLFTAYHLAIATAVFLGAIFSYLFGRANSFSVIGSLILAFVYTLSQTFDGLTTTLSYANSFLVLPILLWAVHNIRQAKRLLHAVPFIVMGWVGVGIGFLAGFPQLVLYGFVFAFAYAVFLDLNNREGYQGLRRALATGGLVLILAGGFLLGLPQFIATFSFIDMSVRTAHHLAEVSRHLRPGDIITLFLPDTVRLPFLTSGGVPGLYIGVFPLVLAVTSVLFFRTRTVLFFFFSWLALFAFAMRIPGIEFINALPIFSRISGAARWLMIGGFPLAFLAASGYERMRSRQSGWFRESGFRRLVRAVGFFSLLLCLGVLLVNIVFLALDAYPGLKESIFHYAVRHKAPARLDLYRAVFQSALVSAQASLSLLNWRLLLPLLLWPAVFFILRSLAKHGVQKWFPFAALGVVAFNIIISFGSFQDYADQLLLKEIPVAARAIRANESGLDMQPFRIMPFLVGEGAFREIFSRKLLSPGEQSIVQRELLINQLGGFYGIETMAGFEPFRSLRHNQLVDTLIGPANLSVFDRDAARGGGRLDQMVNQDVLRPVSIEEKSKDFVDHLGLLSMMNVKYIVSPYSLSSSHLKEISMGPNQYLLVPLHLYENARVLPRWYFAVNPIFWKGDDQGLLLAITEHKDFLGETFIECQNCDMPSEAPGKNTITMLGYTNGRLDLEVESEHGGWFVLSESHLPGRIAEIDGERTPLFTANYLFQSIFVPQGLHRVRFEYVSPFQQLKEKVTKIF